MIQKKVPNTEKYPRISISSLLGDPLQLFLFGAGLHRSVAGFLILGIDIMGGFVLNVYNLFHRLALSLLIPDDSFASGS